MIRVAGVDITVNQTEMRSTLTAGAIRLVDRTAGRVAARARVYAPEDIGILRLRTNPRPAVMVTPTRAQVRVVSDTSYAVYQHEGTGIYGPRNRRIRPVRAKALRFYWRKAGGVVFFRSVRGTRPTKFLTRALREECPEPQWSVTYYTSPV